MHWKAGSALLIALVCASASTTWAQISREGTGTVIGHLTCADTHQPARLAGVTLYNVPSKLTPPKHESRGFEETMLSAQTGLDGSFQINNVPPGDYYAIGFVAGYIPPRNMLEMAWDAGADLTKGIPGLLVIHVAADRTVQTDLSVQRGAAIDGRVLWDDGSPVRGANVTAVPAASAHRDVPSQFAMLMTIGGAALNSFTDDRGHYRLAGLGAGEYVVKARVVTRQRMIIEGGSLDISSFHDDAPLEVYAPGAFHKSEAKPVKLESGEERDDEDIAFNLTGTHSVSGRVSSAEDGHTLNSGSVELDDPSDANFKRTAGLDPDGNFTITFVPPGTYTLAVTAAADATAKQQKDGSASIASMDKQKAYQDAKQQVVVLDNDLTGQNFELAPSKKRDNNSAASGTPAS